MGARMNALNRVFVSIAMIGMVVAPTAPVDPWYPAAGVRTHASASVRA